MRYEYIKEARSNDARESKTNAVCEVSNMLECYRGGYCANDYVCSTYQNKCPYRLVEASKEQLDRIAQLVKDVPAEDGLVMPVRVDQHSEPGD